MRPLTEEYDLGKCGLAGALPARKTLRLQTRPVLPPAAPEVGAAASLPPTCRVWALCGKKQALTNEFRVEISLGPTVCGNYRCGSGSRVPDGLATTCTPFWGQSFCSD